MQRVENTRSFLNIFPEDASSRESWQLLVFSPRGTLPVGFGFAAAANPMRTTSTVPRRAAQQAEPAKFEVK